MSRNLKFILLALFFLVGIGAIVWFLKGTNIPVLDPAGIIGQKERNLIYVSLALALIVVVPVFSLLIIFAVRYREGNDKAKYSPNLDRNKLAETVWWLIPSAIILVLAIIAWNSSHTLDPYKPISSTEQPVNIQVVALDWKWLFIYPDQKVASVNTFTVPVNRPVKFDVTADAPMNSFWVPQLGGQIYAMPGMSTQLNLMATRYGVFNGSSANISGVGFSGMTFTAKATSESDYNKWLNKLSNSPNQLNIASYDKLSQPSQNNSVAFYSNAQQGLYNAIIDKYMMPAMANNSSNGSVIPVYGSNADSMNGMVMQ